MALSASTLLEQKYKLPKSHQEQIVHTTELFKITITNYQKILLPYRELLSGIPLTTTLQSSRNQLIQNYAKTRVQINSENNAASSCKELHINAGQSVGEMTKSAIQAIFVLSSESLSFLWQFDHLNVKSMEEATASFFESCLKNNEGKLSKQDAENASLDAEQLEQFIAMSFALSAFARQKDITTPAQNQADPFFDHIPCVFIPHFQLMNNILNPELNSKFQQYQPASNYRDIISSLYRIAFARIIKSEIFDPEFLKSVESTIRQRQYNEKGGKAIFEIIKEALKRKREDQLSTERLEQINTRKYVVEKPETQLLVQLLTLLQVNLESESEESRLYKEAETYFQSYNEERMCQVLTTFFTYLSHQEILAGKASRVEQSSVHRIIEFCCGISHLWVHTMEQLITEFHHAYSSMNQVSLTSVNNQGLSASQQQSLILPSLVHVFKELFQTGSELEDQINKNQKPGPNIANYSPFYMMKDLSRKKNQLPCQWKYTLPTAFESIKGNTYQIDFLPHIKDRLLKILEQTRQKNEREGKKVSVETIISESPEMHQLITTITKSALNHSSVKDLKILPRFAMVQEQKAFNQCLYEIIGINQQLEGKDINSEVLHINNAKLKEKFNEIGQSGVGQLIDKCMNGRTRIKSPDSLSFLMCFLSSALLATFRLKAKKLAVDFKIQNQQVEFNDEIIKPSDLSQNVEGRLRQFAIIAYQDFIAKRIGKLNMDKDASRDTVLSELWDQTAQLVAELSCRGTVLNECCETASILQQCPKSTQYNIQKFNFLADFVHEYHKLDDSLSRDTTWSELAINELTKTLEKATKRLLITMIKLLLEQQPSDSELNYLHHSILMNDSYNLLLTKNHKNTTLFLNFICQPGLERIPELGECSAMSGGGFGDFWRSLKNGVSSTFQKATSAVASMEKGILQKHGVDMDKQ